MRPARARKSFRQPEFHPGGIWFSDWRPDPMAAEPRVVRRRAVDGRGHLRAASRALRQRRGAGTRLGRANQQRHGEVQGEECLRDLKIMMAIYEAAQTSKTISLT